VGVMFNANNRMSLCASELWNLYEHEAQEYAMDGSGDCGNMIAKHMQNVRLEILSRYGYTAREWNQALRDRLVGEDATMSHRIYYLLCYLEVEPMDEWLDNNTYVYTCGEYSSLAYLKGAA